MVTAPAVCFRVLANGTTRARFVADHGHLSGITPMVCIQFESTSGVHYSASDGRSSRTTGVCGGRFGAMQRQMVITWFVPWHPWFMVTRQPAFGSNHRCGACRARFP